MKYEEASLKLERMDKPLGNRFLAAFFLREREEYLA